MCHLKEICQPQDVQSTVMTSQIRKLDADKIIIFFHLFKSFEFFDLRKILIDCGAVKKPQSVEEMSSVVI